MQSNAQSTIDAEDVARFSRIAEEWWDEKGKFRPLHQINPVRLRYIRDMACRHFGIPEDRLRCLKGLTLLDVGCGGGLLCEPLTRLGASVTGIDASEKNIAVAKLHAEKSGLTIDYRATTPEQFTGQQFDIVLALEIVEHVADVPLFMKSVCALVKPGGLLFMSTLNRTVKSFAMAIVGAEYVLRWLPRGTHDWKQFVTPAELAGHLRSCGMTVADQQGMVFNPFKNSWSLNPRDLDVNYLVTATHS